MQLAHRSHASLTLGYISRPHSKSLSRPFPSRPSLLLPSSSFPLFVPRAGWQSRFDDDYAEEGGIGRLPQNNPDPLIQPSISQSPEECVLIQLRALQDPEKPFTLHGIATAYSFARDAGSMDRSNYFGFPKDLYHMDHFLGMFNTRLGFLLGHAQHEILSSGPNPLSVEGPEAHEVVAAITAEAGPSGPVVRRVKFTLVRGQLGSRAGAWLVARLVEDDIVMMSPMSPSPSPTPSEL